MSVIESILLIFVAHTYWVSFLGALIFGEIAIVFLAFLSGQGVFPTWVLLIFGFLGVILADIFWFLLPRINIGKERRIWKHILKGHKNIRKYVERIAKNNDFALLFITKFVQGTRIITSFYLSLKEMPFLRFISYDLISTSVWLSIIIPLWWIAGSGFTLLKNIFRGVQIGLFALLIFVIVYFALEQKIKKLIFKS